MLNSNEAAAIPLAGDPNSYATPLTDPPRPPIANADDPAWGIASAIFVWIASLVLMLFVPLLLLLPYAASKGLHFSDPNYVKALAELALSDKTAVLLQVIAILPSHLLTFALIWAVVTRLGKRPFWATIGWRLTGRFEIWLWAGLGMALFIVGSMLAWLLGSAKPTQLEQIINSSLAARFTLSILAVATAPFVEEFIYRGLLYPALRQAVAVSTAVVLALVFGLKLNQRSQARIGTAAAVILVLTLFTIIHVPQYWPNVGVIAAVALLSIVLTLVRARTNRLLPCIIIHLVFNGIQAALLIAEPYTQKLVPGSEPVNPTFVILPFLHFLR
ncbi:MAG TPA: CPBP family intramembrane glutamic endopeptidase [Pyrinomonadaceae bacterium]|nr:CPBP family intramembrane glutamic endopeptidase [Pyrinomonadaceae bacterium]